MKDDADDLEPRRGDDPAGIGRDAGKEEVVTLGMSNQRHGKTPMLWQPHWPGVREPLSLDGPQVPFGRR